MIVKYKRKCYGVDFAKIFGTKQGHNPEISSGFSRGEDEPKAAQSSVTSGNAGLNILQKTRQVLTHQIKTDTSPVINSTVVLTTPAVKTREACSTVLQFR